MVGANSVTTNVTFQIANADALFDTTNKAFDDLGGNIILDGSVFDWGMPFFYGRPVYLVIDGQSSSAGAGPFFAF